MGLVLSAPSEVATPFPKALYATGDRETSIPIPVGSRSALVRIDRSNTADDDWLTHWALLSFDGGKVWYDRGGGSSHGYWAETDSKLAAASRYSGMLVFFDVPDLSDIPLDDKAKAIDNPNRLLGLRFSTGKQANTAMTVEFR